MDMGTGAGFPGLIVAVLHDGPVTLVEERKKRVEFLTEAAAILGIEGKVEIIHNKIERLPARSFETISARAFAPLDKLLGLAERFSTVSTRWILPKGRNAKSELEAAESLWQGEFSLEPSRTDPDAWIVIAEKVRRRQRGRRGR